MAKRTKPTDAPPEINGIAVHCSHDEIVPIARVIPNPRNPNKHPDSQLRLLAKVIAAQGWRAPITISRRSGFIVRGHGRYLSALLLGQPSVPVDWQDYENEAAEWADLIADNRIAELAEMDMTALSEELAALDTGDFDMELTGFDREAMEKLLADMNDHGKTGGDNSGERQQPNEHINGYQIIIECEDENEQTQLLEVFIAEGRRCRALML